MFERAADLHHEAAGLLNLSVRLAVHLSVLTHLASAGFETVLSLYGAAGHHAFEVLLER
jgi:hypothetical protein